MTFVSMRLNPAAILAALLAVVFLSEASLAADAPKNQVLETGWSVRCQKQEKKEDPKRCEAFDLLQVKDTHARVAEMALNFAKPGETTAHAVVVLPLGILLEEGVAMKIDDSKTPYIFKVRYCTNAGCIAHVDLSSEILDTMKKGTALHFFFNTFSGQKVDLAINLSGFGKELKKLQ